MVVDYPEGLRKYEKFLVSTGSDLEGMKIAIDAANGAASYSARQVFLDLNADITVIGEEPDGLNINDGVGSTHPEQLQNLVKGSDFCYWPCFDGDSDRLIAVDENGEIVDGDKIMYIIGKYLSEKEGCLKIRSSQPLCQISASIKLWIVRILTKNHSSR